MSNHGEDKMFVTYNEKTKYYTLPECKVFSENGYRYIYTIHVMSQEILL